MDLIGGRGGRGQWLFSRPRSAECPRSKALELTGFREYPEKGPNKVCIKMIFFFLSCEKKRRELAVEKKN